MQSHRLVLENTAATQRLGEQLAPHVRAPLTMTFCGEIGAGKTTFIRAMLKALGVEGAIKSPTFSIVESYQILNTQIHHFDLYRINEPSELEYMGFRDYWMDHAICLIEWPERAMHGLDIVDLSFVIHHQGDGRVIDLSAHTSQGLSVLSFLK